ncbi:MAG: hypothetical protein PHC97_00765 [Patescibacteria group bacterium]|nr:hypothetical protein [Patescibacteria group bacterium]
MLKLICCICSKVLGYSESEFEDESGGICPRCLKEHYPEEYARMRETGKLTIEEITEAEGLTLH